MFGSFQTSNHQRANSPAPKRSTTASRKPRQDVARRSKSAGGLDRRGANRPAGKRSAPRRASGRADKGLERQERAGEVRRLVGSVPNPATGRREARSSRSPLFSAPKHGRRGTRAGDAAKLSSRRVKRGSSSQSRSNTPTKPRCAPCRGGPCASAISVNCAGRAPCASAPTHPATAIAPAVAPKARRRDSGVPPSGTGGNGVVSHLLLLRFNDNVVRGNSVRP